MGGVCRRTPRAEQDVAEIAAYLASRDSQLAVRFLDCVEETFQSLAESPHSGVRSHFPSAEAAGLLIRFIRRFRSYVVFFKPADDGVLVVRVLHAARDLDRILDESGS